MHISTRAIASRVAKLWPKWFAYWQTGNVAYVRVGRVHAQFCVARAGRAAPKLVTFQPTR